MRALHLLVRGMIDIHQISRPVIRAVAISVTNFQAGRTLTVESQGNECVSHVPTAGTGDGGVSTTI
jgi:hypothetical protein